MRRLDDARHGRVQPLAPLLQLRGERHLLRQRMLEEILGDRIQRLLVDELGVLERLQRFAQLRRVLLDDGGQGRLVELAADHRGGLQHVLLPLRQPIDARREQRVHGARHLQLVDRRDQTIGALAALQLPRLDEILHHLLGEERIAAGAGMNRLGQAGDAGVVAEQRIEQLADGVGAERARAAAGGSTTCPSTAPGTRGES